MRFCTAMLILTLLFTAAIATPAAARNAAGLAFDVNGFYPMFLHSPADGWTIGMEAYPSLSYIGIIGRMYEKSDLSGRFGGVVLGTTSKKSPPPPGLSVLRLQGGYAFRIERNGRGLVGLTYDTYSAPNYSSAALGVLVEVHYVW
ncbi:MAG TPA: hypothetical protein GXX29_12240 [Firmicutes bacterium]|nr:hypothetical protein [Bacillota bacterium]